MYAFAAVMIVWVLWAYNMAFGEQCFSIPRYAKASTFRRLHVRSATIPAAASGMPELGFPDGDDDVLPVRLRRTP